MNKAWFQRRWFDFRQGHSVYLIFALTFVNFVLIFHRLLIERIPVLNEMFSSLWLFGIMFIIVYIPLSVAIGAWHRKSQLRIDSEVMLRQNPLWAKFFRLLIDIQLGKASEKEIESVRKLLRTIERGTEVSSDKNENSKKE